MFPGPVFTHELRSIARKPRFYVIRFCCGLFLLYMVLTSWRWVEPGRDLRTDELASIGTGLFVMTLWVQGLTAVFLTPAIVAGTIAEDRQRKILHYMLASPLTSTEIVFGKLLVRLLYLVILVLVGFPIMCLALLFGGVDPSMLALVEVAVLAVIFSLGSLSIFLSSRLKKPRDAIVCAYSCVFIWLMVPVIRSVVESELVPSWPALFGPIERLLAVLSIATPTGAIVGTFSSWGRPPGEGLLSLIGMNLLIGSLFLVPTIRGLRRREQDEGRVRRGWFSSGRGIERGRGWSRSRPFSLDNPMVWKDCPGRHRFLNPAWNFLVAGLKIMVVSLLGTWMFAYAWPAFLEAWRLGYGMGDNYGTLRAHFNGAVRFFTVCGYLLLILLLAAVSAGSITSEKEKDSWISLISTPLEGREILRGKIAGAFWTARYLFVALLILWVTGMVAGSLHPFGFALLVVATAVYSAFAVSLGVHFSSICRTSTRALVATFITLLVLNGGYLMCLLPILRLGVEPPSPFLVIVGFSGVTPLIEGFVACTYSEVDHFLRPLTPAFRPEERLGMVFAYLISVAGYAIAAYLLIQNRIASFDDDADRPRRLVRPRLVAIGDDREAMG